MKSIPILALATIMPALIWVTAADESKSKDAATTVSTDDPFAQAEEETKFVTEAPREPLGVGLLFEWIELDHRSANKLIRKHANKISTNELREVLEKLLDEEKASLAETAYFVAKDLKRAKVESVDEHIYPTEYDPPEIPEKIHKDFPLDQIPIAPANPTAFDVRNVGTTVEAEAHIQPGGQIIALNLAPEIVKHVGDRTIGDPKTLHAALAHIYQPDFYVMKIATNVHLSDGDHSLIGLFTPPGKSDKRVMLMVRANILY